MGFPSQSQSVKLGSGSHFFKCTDINKGHRYYKQLGKHNTRKKKKKKKNKKKQKTVLVSNPNQMDLLYVKLS